ncbi:MAG: winged helix-turn-helix transcriptional regulator [Turicibacter sp.]
MFKVDEEEYDCPVEALANILGKKWVASIIWTLKNNQFRFGELQREIEGCTKKMLTQQLELLIREEIVINKKVIKGNSVESSYYLSEKGQTLLPIVENMISWGSQNLNCHTT